MARDRISTSKEFQSALANFKSNDVLGLSVAENKEAFMLSVALGLQNPTQPKNRIGLFLNTALKTADRALIAAVLLGNIPEGEEIDDYADFDKSAELCEQCAETGYLVLQKKYNDADCDEEMLERRMLKELEILYLKNVDGDLK